MSLQPPASILQPDCAKRRKFRNTVVRGEPKQVGPVRVTVNPKRGKAGRFVVVVEEIDRTQIDARR